MPGVERPHRRRSPGHAPGAALTVADYADRAGASRASARAELRALAGAGFMEMVPATGGLRFRRGGQATSEGDAL